MRLRGQGNDFPKLSRLLPNTSLLYAYDRLVRLKTAWGGADDEMETTL